MRMEQANERMRKALAQLQAETGAEITEIVLVEKDPLSRTAELSEKMADNLEALLRVVVVEEEVEPEPDNPDDLEDLLKQDGLENPDLFADLDLANDNELPEQGAPQDTQTPPEGGEGKKEGESTPEAQNVESDATTQPTGGIGAITLDEVQEEMGNSDGDNQPSASSGETGSTVKKSKKRS